MFKKLVVSVVLGVSLLSSLALWAKSKDEPIIVAKIEVKNQLSLSAHQVGEASFINQIEPSKVKVAEKQDEASLSVTKTSVFWTMAFALLFFVLRGATRRIK